MRILTLLEDLMYSPYKEQAEIILHQFLEEKMKQPRVPQLQDFALMRERRAIEREQSQCYRSYPVPAATMWIYPGSRSTVFILINSSSK